MSDQEQGNGEGSTPEYAASKRKSPPVVTNDGSVRDELSAPEKLRIGGYMAPALRSGAKDGRTKRKVYVEGKDGSVRESTWGEVAQALSIKHGIAFEVAEKTPETTYACSMCAREFVHRKAGARPNTCDQCRITRCACGAAINPWSITPSRIAARKAKPPVCVACRDAAKTAAKRHVFCACGSKLNHAALSPSTVSKRTNRAPMCRGCNNRRTASIRAGSGRVVVCACGKSLGSDSMNPSRVARRNGAPPQCRACFLASCRKQETAQ